MNISFKPTDLISCHGHLFLKSKTANDTLNQNISYSSTINQDNDLKLKHAQIYIPIITCNQCRICRQAINHEWCLRCEECDLKIHHECLNFTDAYPCPIKFDVDKLRHAFLNIFTSIMRNYSKFYPILKTFSLSESLDQIYDMNDFLLDLDLESRLFMNKFSASQSFYVFIRERHPLQSKLDPSLIFFDECIKAKRNRSILQVQKEVVEFLTDETFGLHHTVLFDGPNRQDVNTLSSSTFIKSHLRIPISS